MDRPKKVTHKAAEATGVVVEVYFGMGDAKYEQ
jgi:hypothetical protein